MCKIMIIPKVFNNKKAMQFLKASAPKMSKNDNDGLGYAAMHTNGKISIEKWLNPSDAFKRRNLALSNEALALNPLKNFLRDYSAESYSQYGEGYESSRVASIIYHTRMATCEKSMDNVHPFVRDNTVLIHNGVISNPDAFPPLQSSCDSEALLNAYVELNVPEKLHAVQELSDNLQGYYAAGVFSEKSDGTKILDIIKDNRAQLFVCYIAELKTEVFCTDAKILRDTCKILGWNCGAAHEVEDNVFIRYNALTGKIIDTLDFERIPEYPRPYALDSKIPSLAEEFEFESPLPRRYDFGGAK